MSTLLDIDTDEPAAAGGRQGEDETVGAPCWLANGLARPSAIARSRRPKPT